MTATVVRDDASEKPAHEVSRAHWKAMRGVHAPWVGEVSGVQYGLMSAAARRRYDAQRRAEWQASADASDDYARACVEAYDADPTVFDRASQDAREAIRFELARRAARDRASRMTALTAENADLSTVRDGDLVWWLVGNYEVRVVRVLRASLRVALRNGREVRVDRRECRWLHHNDLVEAEAAGRTVMQQRRIADRRPEVVS